MGQQAFENGIVGSGVLRAQAATPAVVDFGQIQFGGVSADFSPFPRQLDVHVRRLRNYPSLCGVAGAVVL